MYGFSKARAVMAISRGTIMTYSRRISFLVPFLYVIACSSTDSQTAVKNGDAGASGGSSGSAGASSGGSSGAAGASSGGSSGRAGSGGSSGRAGSGGSSGAAGAGGSSGASGGNAGSTGGGNTGDAGTGVCPNCTNGSLCVEHQIEGGARITTDAGQCPPGRVPSGGLCVLPPSYACMTLPSACSPPPGSPPVAHCICARSLCGSANLCADLSPTLMKCTEQVP
jgi:hypothetical protein